MRDTLPALGLMLGMTFLVWGLQLLPRSGAAVAAIYPPGTALETALPALLGAHPEWRLIGVGRGPLLVIHALTEAGTRPVAPPGAWLLLSTSPQPDCLPLTPGGDRS